MPDLQTTEAPRLEARFAPATFNAESRTVELSWGRGVAVERYDWATEQRYTEVLTMDPASVDLSRLQAGAPLLDTHARWSVDSVLGAVERAWIEGGEGRAVVRFSARDDVRAVLRDVQDGIVRNVSVGYSVQEWRQERGADGKLIRTAVRWTPQEISLVPVPADASAQVRAAGDASASPPGTPIPPKEARMAEDANPPATPAVAPQPHDEAAIRAAAQAAERQRIAGLDAPLATARTAGLGDAALGALRTRAIEEGWDAQRLQSQLFEALAAREQRDAEADAGFRSAPPFPPTPVSQYGRSGDDPAAIIDAMSTAIAVRSMPEFRAPAGNDHWRQFASLSPKHMLMELAMARGERVAPRDLPRLIERAFHTTSDFPLLLENAGNKMLMAGYELAAPSFRRVFRQVAFNDFKEHRFLGVGDFPGLVPLGEGGEIKSGTISERRERVTPGAYGRNVSVTQQMLINDDLGAFTEFGSMIGQRVAQDENGLAYAVLNTASGDGPTLAEGSAAVFTTGRGNKAASGTTIDVTNLAAARAAVMKQKTIDGLPIAVGSQMLLLVGPDRELLARQLTATFVASQTSATNPYAGFIDVVVDPLIAGNRWYLFATGTRPYAFGYVNGQTAPRISVYSPVQGRDALQIDVVLYFGAGATDWRGAFFNPGN